MKRFDIAIIIIIILISLVSLGFINFYSNNNYTEKYVQISVDGELVKRISLEDKETFTVKTDLGTNIVKVEDGKAYIVDADCPDKVCIKDGYIDKPGEILVCLPNKVVIEIIGQGKSELDEISY